MTDCDGLITNLRNANNAAEIDRLRGALLDAEHRLRLLADRTGDYSPEGLRIRLTRECTIIAAAALRQAEGCACGRTDEHGPHES